MHTTLIHLDIAHLPPLPPLCLAIGNFDGVHLGHKAMIGQTQAYAKSCGLKTAVLIFEPQPKEFFNPQTAPARLTSLDEKYAKLATLQVDYVLVARFDTEFRLLSAQDFCTILARLNAKMLVIGDDFRFGYDRLGDGAYLTDFGFHTHILSSITHKGKRVSSTAIRLALAQGDLLGAKALLGEPYAMIGDVIHGDKIGRTLGFPTANIAINRLKPALHGVFAVNVQFLSPHKQTLFPSTTSNGIGGTRQGTLFGCASIGTRPSVAGREWRLEVHLPNFNHDLYEQKLLIEFTHFLHGEIHYKDLASLKTGIKNDINALLEWRSRQI